VYFPACFYISLLYQEHTVKKILILSTAVATLYGASLDDFERLSGTLRIAGGTAHIPTMKRVAKEIATVNPDLKIAIAGGGSGVGIKKVGEGLVDIGNAGRKASDKEIRKYSLVLHKWAIDGIAVVVHPANTVQDLNRTVIADIFAGKITNWKAINGIDASIHLYTRDEASGTRKVFWKKFLHKSPIAKNANFVTSNGAMKRVVSGDKAAIGYLSAGFVDASVRGVAIDGDAPTTANIQNGSYPYARGLYSITKGAPKGAAKVFIDYLLSDHVQHEIVPAKGFIPVR
jgi:phosphate transport system substrate-binding protein